MERSQIAAIIVVILFIVFFIILFLKNRRRNHHQDLKDEVLEERFEEESFQKVEQ
jgi:uncharacterized membrane protein